MGRERGCKFEVRVKVAGKVERKEGRISGCPFSAWRWRKEEEEEEEEKKEAGSGDFGRRRGREDRQDRLEGVEKERRGRGLLDISPDLHRMFGGEKKKIYRVPFGLDTRPPPYST